jgi:hypothetical protein
MYEPTQNEIADKVEEALKNMLLDDDFLIDAIIHCLPLFRKLLTCYSSDLVDVRFDLRERLEESIVGLRDLKEEARQCLIAERGATVRTDVDDYKFVPHDTRY